MEITLTPEQESLIQHEIENGRLKSAEEAVQQALSVWEERRRDLIELIAALDESEEDFKAGRYLECTPESLPGIKAEILRNAGVSVGAMAK
jgi:putative addiction module CopG family antidote